VSTEAGEDQVILNEVFERFPIAMEDSLIRWKQQAYEGTVVDEHVTRDYGFAIHTENPFARGRTVVVVAGSHTYGTIAAARHLVEEYSRVKWWRLDDFAFLVEARVEDDHVCPPRQVDFMRGGQA
jgi:hypothetical protein